MSGLARIAAWRGEIAPAFHLQSEALDGFRRMRADDLVLDALVRLVEIHVLNGDSSAAMIAVGEAGSALAALGDVPVVPAMLARLRGRALARWTCDGSGEAFERAWNWRPSTASRTKLPSHPWALAERTATTNASPPHTLSRELGVVAASRFLVGDSEVGGVADPPSAGEFDDRNHSVVAVAQAPSVEALGTPRRAPKRRTELRRR